MVMKKTTVSLLLAALSFGISEAADKITPDTPYLDPFAAPRRGTFVKIYDQDASVKGLGLNEFYMPHAFAKDKPLGNKEFALDMKVYPTNISEKKEPYSDFTGKLTLPQQRAVSIFGTAVLGYDILRRDYVDMLRLTSTKSSYNKPLAKFYSTWKKDLAPITIYQDMGEDQNAYYDRSGTTRSANFFHFTSEDDGKTIIYTGESSDIVGHEIWGHGHLDEMCPWYFDSTSLELGGFHEGHADSMSLTINLGMSAKQRQILLAETGGDLHKESNFLERLGEQFGAAIKADSVRNLDVDAILGKTDQEVHDIGRIWASSIYDTLADAYPVAQSRLVSRMPEEQILFYVSTYLRRIENLSVVLQEKREPGFVDFASKMYQLAQERVTLTGIPEIDSMPWADYFKNQFTRRKISVNGDAGKSQVFSFVMPKEQKGVCGTLHKKLVKAS